MDFRCGDVRGRGLVSSVLDIIEAQYPKQQKRKLKGMAKKVYPTN